MSTKSLGFVVALSQLLAPHNLASANESPTELDPVSVVGTRLSAGAGGERPILRLEIDDLVPNGIQNLGQLLQQLPQMVGAPLNTGVGARGAGGGLSRGVETLDMRGLGSQRTLVLVNGRRFIAGGNGTSGVVDLASIPISAVSAIEVLSGSASVEYGADAVAGVVNVLTHQDQPGLHLSNGYGLSERGDGQQWRGGLRWGQNWGKQQVFVAAELTRQAPVGKSERSFSREQLAVQGPDNEVFARGISSAPPEGNYRTSEGRLTLIDGASGQSPDDFRPFINGGENSDRFNYNPFEDLIQDNQRQSLLASWNYLGLANAELFARALWQQRESSTTLAPLPFFTNRLDGVSVAANNVFNPFEEELSDVRRRLVEAGPRQFSQAANLWRLELGARGQWQAWDWSTQISHGENRVRQGQSGDLRRDRLVLALGPSFRNAEGIPQCGSPDNPVAGCVPLNLFAGPGSITDEMLAYAGSRPLQDRFQNSQTLFNADLRRELAQWPAGEVELALGLEWREETAEDIPDLLTQAGNTTGQERNVTRGGFRSREIYGELGLPLWASDQGPQAVQAELGLRIVDTSLFAAQAVFDAGMRWRLGEDLVLRGGYAQSFRSPTVGELFGGLNQSNPGVNDPCTDLASLSPEQQQSCIDQGIPADGSLSDNGNEVPLLSGGNQDLAPETAQTWRLSLDWSASRHMQLRLAAFAIDIDDAIASLGADAILRSCLNQDAAACARIARDQQGQLQQILSPLSNIAQDQVQGMDLELRWRPQWGAWSLNHQVLISHIFRRRVRSESGSAVIASQGEYSQDLGSIPRWTALYNLQAEQGPWRWHYSIQYLDELRERGGDLFPGSSRSISARAYHDLSLSWTHSQGWQLNATINNLSDAQPPLVINADDANTDVASYRLLGRRYSLNLQLPLGAP